MRLETLLGIDVPVIQAPMAGSQGSALAIAVADAGGLGSLPCAVLGLGAMRDEIAAIRAATAKPFNVNFFCHATPAPDAAREAAWRQALAPYFAEYGIDPATVPVGPGRRPFDAEIAAGLADLRPPIVSFHFGLPADDLLARVRRWGAMVMATATTVAEACWLEARGVDVVIAQGLEAGGHRGHFLTEDPSLQMGTLALVRQVVRAVRVPVVAAGGIADAAGVAAARALGAAGVQVGTAYLSCPEAATSALHRAALASDAADTTAVTNLFTGRPARAIVNRLIRDLGPMSALAPAFPTAAFALAPLRAKAESLGRDDFSPLWAGQSARVGERVGAAELTRTLAAGFAGGA
ncbi:MAG: 2-nitropropane dioxygenase [Polyangiaceae bacterium UTPRO1]|jgi:nitronate monooxygenase|nr:DUF561 domain-containing protein [Myxococcales bacterium]OQY64890.1 MAG: 2-nitropropane dioxygenase [Polyangiaceae bacterium UTPRO1]